MVGQVRLQFIIGLFFQLLSECFSFQFCDIAEVTIQPNMTIKKQVNEKEIELYFLLFTGT
jgi:hypothetical protein